MRWRETWAVLSASLLSRSRVCDHSTKERFLCFTVTVVVGILLLVKVLDCTTREMGRKTSRRRAASVMSGMALNELISIRIVMCKYGRAVEHDQTVVFWIYEFHLLILHNLSLIEKVGARR